MPLKLTDLFIIILLQHWLLNYNVIQDDVSEWISVFY